MGKKETLAHLVESTSLLRVLESFAKRPGLIVLSYHRIGASLGTKFDGGVFAATPERFEAQVTYLKKHFRLVGLGEVAASLSGGFPDACVLLTFDDGYRDNYEVAFPILKRLNVPAAFFVTSGFVDGRAFPWWDRIAYVIKATQRERLRLRYPEELAVELGGRDRAEAVKAVLDAFKRAESIDADRFFTELEEQTAVALETESLMMSWENVREMHQAGMSIGAHTVTHPMLARVSEDSQWRELVDSKRCIEAHIGADVIGLAYPVGRLTSFNARTKALAGEAGYTLAFSHYGGVNQARIADRFDIKRVKVYEEQSFAFFRLNLTTSTTWLGDWVSLHGG